MFYCTTVHATEGQAKRGIFKCIVSAFTQIIKAKSPPRIETKVAQPISPFRDVIGDMMGSRKFDNSEPFQTFLREKNIKHFDELSEVQKSDLREKYFAGKFKELSNNLDFYQRESLSAALRRHGLNASSDTAYQALRELSRNNVNRILSRNRYQSSRDMKVAEELISNLDFSFVHNSLSDYSTKTIATHILSSKRLRKFGFAGGLNSLSKFNSDFLRTDDQIFFHVVPTISRNSAIRFASEYGSGEVYLNQRYANDRAWVSPFIMRPDDLFSQMIHFAPQELSEAVSYFKAKHPSIWNETIKVFAESNLQPDEEKIVAMLVDPRLLGSFMESHAQIMERAISKASSLDFTVGDFTQMTRELSLAWLNRLRTQNPKEYKTFLNRIKAGHQGAVQVMVDNALTAAGLPTRYELKVPSAVPMDAVSVH
jgi:hypothetical protein